MKKPYKLAFISLCLIAAGFAGSSTAEAKGRLKKVWSMRITDIIGPVKGQTPADFFIYGLGFSTDGNRLAAVAGPSRRNQTILILDTADPKANLQKFVVNPEFYEAEFPAHTRSLLWSNTGQDLLLNRSLVHLADGSSCTLAPGIYRFSFTALYRSVNSQFEFFDWNCDYVGNDKYPAYLILDASKDKQLLAITPNSAAISPVDIVQAKSLKPVLRVPVRREPFPNIVRFAENGKTVCGINGTLWEQSASCWYVETGEVISKSHEHSRLDILPALSSPRIIMIEYGRKFDPIELRWALGAVRKRIVWDYRTGMELISWRPKFQRETIRYANGSISSNKQPYRVAISPDGKFIAEGGAGELSVSQIEQ